VWLPHKRINGWKKWASTLIHSLHPSSPIPLLIITMNASRPDYSDVAHADLVALSARFLDHIYCSDTALPSVTFVPNGLSEFIANMLRSGDFHRNVAIATLYLADKVKTKCPKPAFQSAEDCFLAALTVAQKVLVDYNWNNAAIANMAGQGYTREKIGELERTLLKALKHAVNIPAQELKAFEWYVGEHFGHTLVSVLRAGRIEILQPAIWTNGTLAQYSAIVAAAYEQSGNAPVVVSPAYQHAYCGQLLVLRAQRLPSRYTNECLCVFCSIPECHRRSAGGRELLTVLAMGSVH